MSDFKPDRDLILQLISVFENPRPTTTINITSKRRDAILYALRIALEATADEDDGSSPPS